MSSYFKCLLVRSAEGNSGSQSSSLSVHPASHGETRLADRLLRLAVCSREGFPVLQGGNPEAPQPSALPRGYGRAGELETAALCCSAGRDSLQPLGNITSIACASVALRQPYPLVGQLLTFHICQTQSEVG